MNTVSQSGSLTCSRRDLGPIQARQTPSPCPRARLPLWVPRGPQHSAQAGAGQVAYGAGGSPARGHAQGAGLLAEALMGPTGGEAQLHPDSHIWEALAPLPGPLLSGAFSLLYKGDAYIEGL